jgi:hypothetical protein|tara:strand:+ start:395 stop:556 length:162 start_codon:yes stop_codon:yes gene_type:complete
MLGARCMLGGGGLSRRIDQFERRAQQRRRRWAECGDHRCRHVDHRLEEQLLAF